MYTDIQFNRFQPCFEVLITMGTLHLSDSSGMHLSDNSVLLSDKICLNLLCICPTALVWICPTMYVGICPTT